MRWLLFTCKFVKIKMPDDGCPSLWIDVNLSYVFQSLIWLVTICLWESLFSLLLAASSLGSSQVAHIIFLQTHPAKNPRLFYLFSLFQDGNSQTFVSPSFTQPLFQCHISEKYSMTSLCRIPSHPSLYPFAWLYFDSPFYKLKISKISCQCNSWPSF
jgi:hypothetical protein